MQLSAISKPWQKSWFEEKIDNKKIHVMKYGMLIEKVYNEVQCQKNSL